MSNWTGEPARDSHANLYTARHELNTHTFDTRVPQNDGTAQNAAHYRAHLKETVSEPPQIMQRGPGSHERSLEACT